MPWPDDDTKRNPLQLPQPLPQSDAMGGVPQADATLTPNPSADPTLTEGENEVTPQLGAGKIDTPVGPITPPHPEVVAKSGGLGGYLKGVIGRLPKALAIMESSYGNSAPLQAIEQEEARQQAAVQQQFANTITAQRESRAQQLFGPQLEKFKAEIAYQNVQTKLAEAKVTDEHTLATAREVIQNLHNQYGPDAIAQAHRILQSYGVEKPEQEQYMTDASGRLIRLPKTGEGPATPMTTQEQVPNPQLQPSFVGPVAPGAPATLPRQVPTMMPTGPKDDVSETFQLGVKNGVYTNDRNGWIAAVRDVALAKHVSDPAAQGNKADTRLDRSYQFHTGRLETLAKPIEDRLGRLANLQASVSANSPLADSLIAPELLTAMAGGQGSGLRMNEAEIARIVGGRNNWETLKSKVLAWQADPSKPFQLLPEQRKQAQALMNVVAQRAAQQTQLLRDAQSRIAISDDPQEHKRIYAEMRKQIDDIMLGAAQEPQHPKVPPKGADVVDMSH